MPDRAKMKRLILLVLILLPALAFAPLEQADNMPIMIETKWLFYGYIGSDIQAHRFVIDALSWSPDGKYFAVSDRDTWLHIWDMETGQKVFLENFSNQLYVIHRLKWSPNSHFLAFTSNDLETYFGDKIFVLPIEENTAYSTDAYLGQLTINKMEWLSNTQIIALGHRGRLGVWNVTEGDFQLITDEAAVLREPEQFALSPDASQGAYITRQGDFFSGACELKVFDIERQEIINSIEFLSNSACITSIWWSPIGNLAALEFTTEGIQVLNTQTGQQIAILPALTNGRLFGWSPDGRYLTMRDYVQESPLVKIYDVMEQRWVGELIGWWVLWSTDSDALVTFRGELLDISSGQLTLLPIPVTFDPNTRDRVFTQWLCDTPFILGAGADTILVWDSRTQELVNQIAVDFEIDRMMVSPACGEFAVIGGNGFIQIFTYTITE